MLFGVWTSVDWRAVYPLIVANVALRQLFRAIRSVRLTLVFVDLHKHWHRDDFHTFRGSNNS